MFKKATGYNSEKAADVRKKKEEELGGGDIGPRIDIKLGKNVLMWLPAFSDNPNPYRPLLIHFGPRHLCGRKDPVYTGNPSNPWKEDKNFKNCPRCLETWNAFEAMGKPSSYGIGRKLSTIQVAIQCLNLTPFFKDDNKSFVKPNKTLMKQHGDAFLKLLKGEIEQPPEDMPEDMAEAALAGPQLVLLNRTDAVKLIGKFSEKFEELGEEDPLLKPDSLLLQLDNNIDKKNEFTDSKGKVRHPYLKTFKFCPVNADEEWNPICEGIISFVEGELEKDSSRVVDIHNLQSSAETLKEQLEGDLVKPDFNTLNAYLEEVGWSAYETEVIPNDEDEDDDDEFDSSPSLEVMPDAMPLGDADKLAAMRAQLKGEG